MDGQTLGMIGILVAAVGTMIGVMGFLQSQTSKQIAGLKAYLELKITAQDKYFTNDLLHMAKDVSEIRNIIKTVWKYAMKESIAEAVQKELAEKEVGKRED